MLGHLLNQRLGGAGDKQAHLTPISFSMNARHYSEVESNLVNNIGTKKKPRWFFYEVKVNYPSPGRTISKAEKDKGVVSEEGLLATEFPCKWYEMETDTNDDTKLKKKSSGIADSKSIPHKIPPYPDT